ncbi:MAG: hypothetical protein PHF35_01500 [Candidatus Moranbacteria bacterium]|nr:hypothetical protein [Candidatus Moranbacteria bacterium]
MPTSNFRDGARVSNFPKDHRESPKRPEANPAENFIERSRRLRSGAFSVNPQTKGREPQQESDYKNQLKQLRQNVPSVLPDPAKAGKLRTVFSTGRAVYKKIDMSRDWLFFFLLTFAMLKDIFDIAFMAVGTGTSSLLNLVPVAGQIATATMGAIGMTITFVSDLMFLILTVTVLVLAGEKLANRGFAKYIMGIAVEFMAEALPGISLLPWTVIYVFVLYLCVLYDRGKNESGEGNSTSNPASATT